MSASALAPAERIAPESPAAFEERAWLAARPRPRSRRPRFDEFWPLQAFFYLFPLWWVLGLSQVIFFILAVPMAARLLRQGDLRVPRGFGLLGLFLLWVTLGAMLVYVDAPGTEDKAGVGPVVGYAFRLLWYLSITIAMLYVLNSDRTRLTATRIGRMFAFLFLVTVAGGLLGLTAPTLDFPSALELVLPNRVTQEPFMNSLFHPRVALASDFLGYDQPRVTAPFAYPNSWGNSFGLLLPFFLATWFGRRAGWRRYVGPVLLLAALVPMVYSLNRGLWAGIALGVLWVTLRRILDGDVRTLVVSLTATAALLAALLVTPLGGVIALRVNTPHSDDRRLDTASEVIDATLAESPLLGYGGTRQKVGNFDSIAGGAAPGCHQCSAPPLGTQGFLWGLIFMTGFAGAALMLAFLLRQWWINARRSTPLALITSTVVGCGIFFFFFYDSLDVPLLIIMITIGLSARDHSVGVAT